MPLPASDKSKLVGRCQKCGLTWTPFRECRVGDRSRCDECGGEVVWGVDTGCEIVHFRVAPEGGDEPEEEDDDEPIMHVWSAQSSVVLLCGNCNRWWTIEQTDEPPEQPYCTHCGCQAPVIHADDYYTEEE